MIRKIFQVLKLNWIKYGFETVVVTVGILGAFSLESWKDNRQDEKELLEIYRTIADDLQTDAIALDTILDKYLWRIEIMERILTQPVTADEWVDNDSLISSFFGFQDFRESLRGLDLLKSKITAGGEAGILADRISKFYNVRLLENSVTQKEVDDVLYSNLHHWTDNASWLSTAIIDEDRSLLSEYVEDNPLFRNRISVYLLVFSKRYRELSRYKEECNLLAEEINAFLENNS